jgi:hypothetical protein
MNEKAQPVSRVATILHTVTSTLYPACPYTYQRGQNATGTGYASDWSSKEYKDTDLLNFVHEALSALEFFTTTELMKKCQQLMLLITAGEFETTASILGIINFNLRNKFLR